MKGGCVLYIDPAGDVVLLDVCDAHLLSDHNWHINRHRDHAVLRAVIGGEKVAMHRMIAGATDGEVVDHVNGNSLDNRRSNLRLCSGSENARNRRKHSAGMSAYKGVTWSDHHHKWRALIHKDKKRYLLGYFDSEQDAAKAYDKAAIQHHGEFARLNFQEG